MNFFCPLIVIFLFPNCSSENKNESQISANQGRSNVQLYTQTKAACGKNISVSYDRKGSLPTSVQGVIDINTSNNPNELIAEVIDKTGYSIFAKNQSDNFKVVSDVKDELGMRHLRLQQILNNTEVFGGQLILHFGKENKLVSIDGKITPEPNLNIEPKISGSAAVAAAKQQLASHIQNSATKGIIIRNEPFLKLVILDMGIISNTINDPKLAWQIDTEDGYRSFVDAATGKILWYYNDIKSALNREVYSLGNSTSSVGGTLWLDESGWTIPMNDADCETNPQCKDALDAYRYSAMAYQYFFDNFGRDSWDNAGLKITSKVHWNNSGNRAMIAHYNPSTNTMVFSNRATTYATVAHEYTHGVISYAADLIYSGFGAILHEFYSDYFGSRFDNSLWINQVSNPEINQNPDSMFSRFMIPVIPNLCGRIADNCGSHVNSIIFGHIIYHLNQPVNQGGFGVDDLKMQRILYRTLTTHLVSSANFNDMMRGTIASCEEFASSSSYNINNSDCDSIEEAFRDHGLPIDIETQFTIQINNPRIENETKFALDAQVDGINPDEIELSQWEQFSGETWLCNSETQMACSKIVKKTCIDDNGQTPRTLSLPMPVNNGEYLFIYRVIGRSSQNWGSILFDTSDLGHIDSDGDEIRDIDEWRLGTDPYDPDSDHDGLYDLKEYNSDILDNETKLLVPNNKWTSMTWDGSRYGIAASLANGESNKYNLHFATFDHTFNLTSPSVLIDDLSSLPQSPILIDNNGTYYLAFRALILRDMFERQTTVKRINISSSNIPDVTGGIVPDIYNYTSFLELPDDKLRFYNALTTSYPFELQCFDGTWNSQENNFVGEITCNMASQRKALGFSSAVAGSNYGAVAFATSTGITLHDFLTDAEYTINGNNCSLGSTQALTWNSASNKFGLIHNCEGLFLTILHKQGNSLTQEISIPINPPSENSEYKMMNGLVAWSGETYGTLWTASVKNEIYEIYQPDRLFFTPIRVNNLGQANIRGNIAISDGNARAISPSMQWDGEKFAIAWIEEKSGKMQLKFTRVSANGIKEEEKMIGQPETVQFNPSNLGSNTIVIPRSGPPHRYILSAKAMKTLLTGEVIERPLSMSIVENENMPTAGAALQVMSNGHEYSFVWDARSEQVGTHTLTFAANDGRRVMATRNVTFDVKNTAPKIYSCLATKDKLITNRLAFPTKNPVPNTSAVCNKNGTITVAPGQTLTLHIKTRDAENDSSEITANLPPGTVSKLAGGIFTYRPDNIVFKEKVYTVTFTARETRTPDHLSDAFPIRLIVSSSTVKKASELR